MEGKRKQTNIFVCRNFIYSKNHQTDTKFYLRCINKKRIECPGCGTIDIATDLFTLSKQHNYPDMEENIKIRRLKFDAKVMVENPKVTPREAFDAASQSNSDIAHLVGFNELNSVLNKRISKRQKCQNLFLN